MDKYYETIEVSLPKFEEIERKMTHNTIVDGYISEVTIIDSKMYAVTGGCGNGRNGWEYFTLYEVVPIENYKGKCCPLDYTAHWQEVDKNNRVRSYAGMKVSYNHHLHVFDGLQLWVYCNNEYKQLELF